MERKMGTDVSFFLGANRAFKISSSLALTLLLLLLTECMSSNKSENCAKVQLLSGELIEVFRNEVLKRSDFLIMRENLTGAVFTVADAPGHCVLEACGYLWPATDLYPDIGICEWYPKGTTFASHLLYNVMNGFIELILYVNGFMVLNLT